MSKIDLSKISISLGSHTIDPGNGLWSGGLQWPDVDTTGTSTYTLADYTEGLAHANLSELTERISAIEDRLNILIPDPAKLEKYAMLKEAYDDYKAIEALLYTAEEDE